MWSNMWTFCQNLLIISKLTMHIEIVEDTTSIQFSSEMVMMMCRLILMVQQQEESILVFPPKMKIMGMFLVLTWALVMDWALLFLVGLSQAQLTLLRCPEKN